LLQKFGGHLSREIRTKYLGAESDAIDSKFQTLCCPVKTRKKFPSFMVYVMISPNYAVYVSAFRHVNQSKR